MTAAETARCREKRRKAGKCWFCASPAEKGKTLCQEHLAKARAREAAPEAVERRVRRRREKGHAPSRCGTCGRQGHNSRTCVGGL